MATYPDKKFQGIYDSIIASMGDDDELKANIENALRPLYEQSLADLNQRRIERNAAIDVDAASRGMGNSTWVTDAKLRQLKDTEGNIATLNANYNNQLYSALADAIKDRDDDAYNKALFWWKQGNKGGNGGGTPTLTTDEVPDDTLSYDDWWALQNKGKGSPKLYNATPWNPTNPGQSKPLPKAIGGTNTDRIR